MIELSCFFLRCASILVSKINVAHVILFSKQQSALGKYKGLLSDRDAKIQDLEEMLGKEKDESKKQLSLIEEEVRIRTNNRKTRARDSLV